ncbi:MAG: 2OG-Fe(II) oxygenase, partial [Acidimicrobiales bacterium]
MKIGARSWNATLRPALERVRRDLGLPEGARLRPEFHSMLVYAPGQFFVPHQDSEKDDAMVGSLVAMLPSSFEGGALEIRHGGEVKTYRGSKTAISLVAFYSDCRHRTGRVRRGYRVVLTYNLLLDGASIGEDTNAGYDSAQLQALATAIRDHFRGAGRRRLVYLLDHEYTASGLSWRRLKGPDAEPVAMLRAAAQRTDCEAVLALADVHETWSAYEARERLRYGRRHYRSWDDDFDADDGSVNTIDEEYELEELIESEVMLESWLDSSGRMDKVALSVSDLDICAGTPSGDLTPYEAQYEGYMGNWGNTLDRWYHSGALVLWPSDLGFGARAEATPAYALDLLLRQVRSGDLAGGREAASTLAPVWEQSVTRTEATGLLGKTLRAASSLDDPGLAAMLLRPFRLEQLRPGDAMALSVVAEHYGEPWTEDLVASWSGRRWHRSGPGFGQFVASLPTLCTALIACRKPGSIVASRLLRVSFAWAAGELKSARGEFVPSRRRNALTVNAKPLA